MPETIDDIVAFEESITKVPLPQRVSASDLYMNEYESKHREEFRKVVGNTTFCYRESHNGFYNVVAVIYNHNEGETNDSNIQ